MRTFDVVVIGGGGAGLAAAIEAARAGASVVLFEKSTSIGGTTALSVGSYTSSETPHQKKKGIKDSVDAHFVDMDKVNALAIAKGYADNLDLRRLLTHGAPGTFAWLMELGIEFVGPNPEPPHSAPRMHNVVPSSAAFPYYLGRACQKLGVSIECGCSLAGLQVTDAARTVRIRREDGQEQDVEARRGIVLTTGDFAASHDIKARYFGPEVTDAIAINPCSTGDGIRLGESLGGTVLNGSHANSPRMRFVPAPKTWLHKMPPTRGVAKTIQLLWNVLPARVMRPFILQFITTALGPEPTLFKCGAILVGKNGQNVAVDVQSTAFHLAREKDNLAYIVFDSKVALQLEAWPNFISTAPGIAYAYLKDYKAARRDIYHEADTLEGLARALHIDAERLRATVSRENVSRPSTARIEGPRFFALGPVRAYVTMTEGGLRVDSSLRVLGADDTPIPGLYAAGSTGQGGVLLEGHGHHLSWAFISGREAGRNAARFAKTRQPIS